LHNLQSDSVSYFLDEIERLAKPDYVPTHKDILHCRKATKGVYEFCVKVQVSCNYLRLSQLLLTALHICCRTFHLCLSMWADSVRSAKSGPNALIPLSRRLYS